MAYCLDSPYCSVSFFVIEGGNSQSARVSWGVAAWKAKCSILCLRLVLLQVLGKTRKVKLLRQIKAHGLQFNLFEFPFKWKYSPFLQVRSLKPAKWSRKKLCPVHIPAWWTFLCWYWAVVYRQGKTLGREPAQQEASLAMNRSKTALQKEQCPVWTTSFTTTST